MFNVAETALLQGIDLYTPNANRLAAALEFHAAYLNKGAAKGYPATPYDPPSVQVSDPLVCGGVNLKLSYAATYQVGLAGLSRLGRITDLPQTEMYVTEYLWKLHYNDLCPPFMYCYEALTHGGLAPKDVY